LSESFARLCERVCQERGWELLPNGVRLVFEDGRQQLVVLETFEHEDALRLRLTTRIGALDALPASQVLAALRANAYLAHGALAAEDDALTMTDTLTLDALDARELEAGLLYLAQVADRYEKQLFGTDEN